MLKKAITLNAFAILVLSTVIATPSFAQNKKDSLTNKDKMMNPSGLSVSWLQLGWLPRQRRDDDKIQLKKTT